MKPLDDTKLQDALKQIQLRAQVTQGRTLTHSDLAELAGVGKRSLGDWMRGVTAPIGMSAIFELLAHLSDEDALAVLDYWKSRATCSAPPSKGATSPTKRKSREMAKPDVRAQAKRKTPK
jgi:transcriptional regulator with XRE-family HTH domain